jgi:hypothetical protein
VSKASEGHFELKTFNTMIYLKQAVLAFLLSVFAAFRCHKTEGMLSIGFGAVAVVATICGLMLVIDTVRVIRFRSDDYNPHDQP